MASISRNDYTNRYVDAATRPLDADQRDDHALELRGSIQDLIDVRVARGEEPADAEIAVLNDMGDPAVLAARYADRPLHLIGPRWYSTWRRILRVVLWSSLPFVAVALIIATVLEGRTLWGIITQTAGTTLTVGAWIYTVVTIVFARLDRAGADAGPWTVDLLPVRDPNEDEPAGRGEKILGFVAVVWAVGGLVLLTLPWDVPGAGRMSVLDPALWPWSLIVGTVLILAGAFVTMRARATGRWGIGAAVANAVIAVVATALIVGLTVTGLLFDPAFVAFIDIDLDAQRVLAVLGVVGTIGVAGWSVFDAFRHAVRRSATRP